MTTERNFTSIGRATGNSGQNIEHFMTNSPWSAQSVLVKVRQEIAQVPEFATGGMLLLDESADEKSSSKSAGAGRQHNGRLGKIEMSQVGTFLSYVNNNEV
jgi:FOG: Transposase